LIHVLVICLSWRGCIGGQDASARPEPPEGVPDRTLTFESYFNDPSFRPHIPVYHSEVDVVSYIPDRIVSLFERTELPAEPKHVRVLRAYRRPRQIDDMWGEGWEELTGENAGLFRLSAQQDRMVLVVNMSSARDIYAPLGATGRVNHYDPLPDDGIVPFEESVGHEGQKLAYYEEGSRQEAARAEDEAAARQVESDISSRLPGLLGISRVSKSTSLADVEYDALVDGLPTQPLLFSSQFIFDYTLLLQVRRC
jgi:hypothetical protein